MKGVVSSMTLTALSLGAMIGAVRAPAGTVEIDTSTIGEPISPYVYGQFIEHLGRCIYGGIWAEMLEDRKFYYPVTGERSGWEAHQGDTSTWQGEGAPFEILVASPWQIVGPPESVRMSTEAPYVGEHDPVITLSPGEPRGIFHPRLGLVAGRKYVGHIVLKASGAVERVDVALVCGAGPETEDVVAIATPEHAFRIYPLEFTSRATVDTGRIAIRGYGKGEVRIGVVSLMPADHVDGFRADTLALLRELDAPIYRWPGGNFVSGYDWRDGVGDRDKRPPRKNPAWTGIEHNDVGIHEYMRLCELLQAEPFIALNTGLGDAASAAAEVAYITGAPDTAEGAKRAANGHTEPWKAMWWAVGNEMYGDWQLGHMPIEEYVRKHKDVVNAIREVSPSAKFVGVGQAGPWSETMLDHCAGHMDLISEHLYWQHRPDVAAHVRVPIDQIQSLADAHRKYRERLGSLAGKDIRIALDEWNYWYGPYLYGELGVRYFMRDALGVAAALHTMFRNSDLYFMANYAQTVNVIGAIKTTKTGAFFESTGQVLKLYRHEFGTLPVRVTHDIDGVDVAAAWTADKKTLTVGVVNTRGEAVELELRADGMDLDKSVTGWIVQHANPDAYNDESNPDNVSVRPWVSERARRLRVWPYSVTLMVLGRAD